MTHGKPVVIDSDPSQYPTEHHLSSQQHNT